MNFGNEHPRVTEPPRPIKLSVALVTRNRPDSLRRTLASLRAQSVEPWEVIISDDSDQVFVPSVQELAQAYGCRYVSAPRRGLYANRTYAALACRGTHIRTMDDDHEFPPDHIQSCLEAIRADPNSVWIIGEYLPTKADKSIPPPCPGQLHPRGFSVKPSDTQASWAMADGAAIFPRDIFDNGILYGPDFAFGTVYLEFGSLLYWLGRRIRALETTYVVHHAYSNTRSYSNVEDELAARIFAMLCHSLMYQPTLRNKVLSGMEIGKQLILHHWMAVVATRRGWAAYRRRCRQMAKYRMIETSDDRLVEAVGRKADIPRTA